MDSHWIRANFAKASTIMGFHGPVSINLSAPSTANSFKFVLLGKKRTKQLQPVWFEFSSMTSLKTKPTKPESTRSQAYSLTCDPFLSVLRKGNKETNQEPQRQQGHPLTWPTNHPINQPTNKSNNQRTNQPRTTQAPRTLSDLRAEVEGLAAAWRETEESFDTLKRWRRSPLSF